jgi:hypothetical protein
MDSLPAAPSEVAKRLIALYGGIESARRSFEKAHRELSERWNQDAKLIGRLLRAHLFVEHFLAIYLSASNPNLGNPDLARLSFSQKLALAVRPDGHLAYLIPGIRRLNKVRNRIAHTLSASVTTSDRDVFLGIALFKELRDALAAPEIPSDEPVEVLEAFARHAGTTLASAASPDAPLWRKALEPDIDESATTV